MALPTEQDPVFPTASPTHQEEPTNNYVIKEKTGLFTSSCTTLFLTVAYSPTVWDSPIVCCTNTLNSFLLPERNATFKRIK